MNRIFRNDRMLVDTLKTEFELTWFAHNYNLKCKHTITHRILSSHRWLDLECLCVSFAFFFFLSLIHSISSCQLLALLDQHQHQHSFDCIADDLDSYTFLWCWLCQFAIQMDDDQLHVYKRNWSNTIKLLAFFKKKQYFRVRFTFFANI